MMKKIITITVRIKELQEDQEDYSHHTRSGVVIKERSHKVTGRSG